MSWSVSNFLDSELMTKVMNGEYEALRVAVAASNMLIQQGHRQQPDAPTPSETSAVVSATGVGDAL